MSSGWSRPKPRTYEYNYQLQASQYRPTLSVLNERASKAEKTQTYEDTQDVQKEPPHEPLKTFNYYSPKSLAGYDQAADDQYKKFKASEESLNRAKKTLDEMEERKFPQREPLWKVHPFYLPEDRERVPPHEDSVWPESRQHFDLVSSYDLMVGFLGIKAMGEREMAKNVKRD